MKNNSKTKMNKQTEIKRLLAVLLFILDKKAIGERIWLFALSCSNDIDTELKKRLKKEYFLGGI